MIRRPVVVPQLRQPPVREAQERDLPGIESEGLVGGNGLDLAIAGERSPQGRGQAKLHAVDLCGKIEAIAVGDEDDTHVCARPDRGVDETSGAQGLIVAVRREDQDALVS